MMRKSEILNTPQKKRRTTNVVKFGEKAEAVIATAVKKPLIKSANLRPILSISKQIQLRFIRTDGC